MLTGLPSTVSTSLSSMSPFLPRISTLPSLVRGDGSTFARGERDRRARLQADVLAGLDEHRVLGGLQVDVLLAHDGGGVGARGQGRVLLGGEVEVARLRVGGDVARAHRGALPAFGDVRQHAGLGELRELRAAGDGDVLRGVHRRALARADDDRLGADHRVALRADDGDDGLRDVAREFAQRLRLRHGRIGVGWQGRFRCTAATPWKAESAAAALEIDADAACAPVMAAMPAPSSIMCEVLSELSAPRFASSVCAAWLACCMSEAVPARPAPNWSKPSGLFTDTREVKSCG